MKAQAPTAVKICGITTVNQALSIASLGADAIGTIGVPESPRFLSEKKRRVVFESLIKNAPSVERVWVVANLDSNSILQGLKGIGAPTIVQLHGSESRQKCIDLKRLYPHIKFWKSFQIRHPKDLDFAKSFQDCVDALLIDAWSSKSLGGTGQRVPTELLSKINFDVPWWLAGGVSIDWIKTVILKIKPFGIDASIKLEINPGIKDLGKVKALLDEVKGT